ncbi:MAG TPA: GH25 family lysozyme [Flavobacteriales bacterium]|nr:GH25 family lysozyme [Flavobacteriales bacterium]
MRNTIWLSFVVMLFLQSCFLFRRTTAYDKQNNMAVQGIDISHHQGTIDWNELKKEKLAFIFMKATESTAFTDPAFKKNLVEAKATGHAVGAYHFFNFCKTGSEQALHFIATVPKGETILPILDLEFDADYECHKTENEVAREVNAFIEKIKANYGRTPVLYMPVAFYKRYAIGNFKNCELWIRSTEDKPSLPDNRKWHFWQYADKGNKRH